MKSKLCSKSGATALNCAERRWQLQNIQSICSWLRENAKRSAQAEQIWKPCELICNAFLPYMQCSAENCHMWLCTPFATDTRLTSCLLNQFNQHIYLITPLLISLPTVRLATSIAGGLEKRISAEIRGWYYCYLFSCVILLVRGSQRQEWHIASVTDKLAVTIACEHLVQEM